MPSFSTPVAPIRATGPAARALASPRASRRRPRSRECSRSMWRAAARGKAPDGLGLFRLDSGRLNDLAELRDAINHQCSQMLRRATNHGVAVVFQKLVNFRLVQDPDDLGIQTVDDGI